LHWIPLDDHLWLYFADMGHKDGIFNVNWNIPFSLPNDDSDISFYISPLFHAVHEFRSDILVKRFADYGYDLDEKWKKKPSQTISKCCLEAEREPTKEKLVLLLIELGANPNGYYIGLTGLQHTIAGHIKTLYHKLLEHPKIDLDDQDYAGRTALHYLVLHGDTEDLTKFLRCTGFNVNSHDRLGFTPLHFAISLQKKETMELLLKVPGIRVDLTDNQGRTPLTLATYWGHRDIAYAFIQNVDAYPVPEPGHLSSVVSAAIHGDKPLTTKLLEKYCYSNLDDHIDLAGKGILHHAAINDWPDVIESCLNQDTENISVNKIDRSGATALHQAAALGNVDSCQVLLKFGASVRFQDRNGRTAAHAAADSGFKDVFMVLLQAEDIDVTQKDHQGRSLVHWTASIDWLDVVQALMKKPGAGLCLTGKDNLGKIPIDIAYDCRCPLVGRYLAHEMKLRGVPFVHPYNWRSLISKSITIEVEEELWKTDLVTRDLYVRRRNSVEREEISRQYPAEYWSLVLNPIWDKGNSSSARHQRAPDGSAPWLVD